VIDGYVGGASDAFTADGWFRTGDLGELDLDGYLRISGRAKELIITGGYNVYPREVEELLRTHAGVADAAVVGAPSKRWGETVVAFVVSAGDPSNLVAELEAFVAEHLVAYKRPREWRIVAAIPRNALGKITRYELVP
jgi:malonyl-CoA/methylmalonyl-CoA synthetase